MCDYPPFCFADTGFFPRAGRSDGGATWLLRDVAGEHAARRRGVPARPASAAGAAAGLLLELAAARDELPQRLPEGGKQSSLLLITLIDPHHPHPIRT